jgi:hypothetical protein
LEKKNEFRNAFPNSQVPDSSQVIPLLSSFVENGSVGDRKVSGRPTVLSDVSVGKIPYFLVQFPRKFQLANKNCKYIEILFLIFYFCFIHLEI